MDFDLLFRQIHRGNVPVQSGFSFLSVFVKLQSPDLRRIAEADGQLLIAVQDSPGLPAPARPSAP